MTVSNVLNINSLFKSGKWIEFSTKKNKQTANGFTYFYHINIRIIDICVIDFKEIDNPQELRLPFNGKTHKLVKISIDVVNKSLMPIDLQYAANNIMLLGDDGSEYEIFNDIYLLLNSKYSFKHQIQWHFVCNPNILYRSALIFSIPKEIQEFSINHSERFSPVKSFRVEAVVCQ